MNLLFLVRVVFSGMVGWNMGITIAKYRYKERTLSEMILAITIVILWFVVIFTS